MRPRARRIFAAITGLSAAAVIATTVLPAAADQGGWTAQPAPFEATELSGVSCWASNGCIAVGRRGPNFPVHSERWDGTTWQVLPTPALPEAKLASVSCWAADACMAVGNARSGGYAMRWDGVSWRVMDLPSTMSVWGVSCWGPAGCMTAGGLHGRYKPYVAQWNGKKWKRHKLPSIPGGAWLGSVSCASAKACTAVGGTARGKTLALRWNGQKKWKRTATPTPAGGGTFFAVACWEPTGCMAVGSAGAYGGSTFSALRNGATWVHQPVVATPETSSLSGISCWSATGCIAVGGFPGRDGALAQRWDGIAWSDRSPTTPIDNWPYSHGLWAISCWSPDGCMTVGNSNRQVSDA